MTGNDNFRTMTDEQLAQWHQLTTRVDYLTRALADARAATDAAHAAHCRADQDHRAETIRQGDVILDLTRRHADQLSATRRANAGVVVILKALRAVLDAFGSDAVLAHRDEWPGEVFQTIAEAWEVVNLHDIPF